MMKFDQITFSGIRITKQQQSTYPLSVEAKTLGSLVCGGGWLQSVKWVDRGPEADNLAPHHRESPPPTVGRVLRLVWSTVEEEEADPPCLSQ